MLFQLIVGSLGVLTCSVKAQQSVYQQCGGIGWSGATTCTSGSTCAVINPYYSQCLPGSTSAPASTSTSASSTSTASSTTSTSSTSVPSSTSPANLSPEWAAAYTKAQAAVLKLSLADKVSLGSGVGWEKGNCVGNTPPISSISFPGLCLEDSPLGVRDADFVSAFPPAINVAATFNRTLMQQRGVAMGQEFRGKGVNVALGPMMNLMRAPAAGRNWEGFGGDPYLSGEGAYETIMGIQSTGVQATAKHYINNEQEHSRTTSSSEVDDRTEHELYAIPFLRSVQANVAAVMCSYNQINGSFACENDKTLNGILKGEFAFPGYVMSDWGATHSTAPAVNAGLDMTMPGDMGALGAGGNWFGQNLVDAVNNGSVSEARVTDLATRVLAAWYLVGQDSDYPPVNFDAWNLNAPVNTHVNVQADHKDLILEIDRASTVLLKNTAGVLPLKKPSTLAIVGNGAFNSSKGPNGYSDRSGDDGVLAMGWGSGTDNFPYLIAPIDAITSRASTQGTVVSSSSSDTDLNSAAAAAINKDVALVFITADSGEGYLTVEGNEGDRNDLSAWHSGDALVSQVASVNSNTVVVVNSVGPIIMESWIDNANVTAVVWSGLPGQEAGNGVTDILYGDYNPSGRLPFTIAKATTDYSAQVIYQDAPDSDILPIPYNEGIFIDYRHFDAANIAPRFEFGFGLSYTSFAYSGLSVSGSTSSSSSAPSSPGAILNSWFHDAVVNVTFTVDNNGTVAGNEIPQLYITLPPSAGAAPMNLKGFDSVFLASGESTQVTMSLSRFDFSVWDVPSQQWLIPSGTSTISIGASSRDIRLTHTITN
ncbi:glycoside hydrolase family 3 protein [Lentinula lateritia]|uniref:beta-glucosidase n=1 Tax=Lentinula lateritia TaxID=40482 RepID=A0ABQ8VH77_9AGAR|nr:glycoside hydrolase family 3 protein [Lentinula lateritia]